MGIEGVEPKLRTSNLCGDGWQEEKDCTALLLKLVFSIWEI